MNQQNKDGCHPSVWMIQAKIARMNIEKSQEIFPKIIEYIIRIKDSFIAKVWLKIIMSLLAKVAGYHSISSRMGLILKI